MFIIQSASLGIHVYLVVRLFYVVDYLSTKHYTEN